MTQVIVILESKPRGGAGHARQDCDWLSTEYIMIMRTTRPNLPWNTGQQLVHTYVQIASSVLINMGYISVISFGLPWTEIDDRPRSRRKLDDAKRVVWRTYGPFHLSETLGQVGCHCQWIDDQQSLLYVYFWVQSTCTDGLTLHCLSCLCLLYTASTNHVFPFRSNLLCRREITPTQARN